MSKILWILKVIWNIQRAIVYPAGFAPHPRFVITPDLCGMPYQDVELITKDNVKLRCFLIPGPDLLSQANARATVILFHGNAMNHGDTLSRVSELMSESFATLTVEYRGYGHNEGVPSERGLCLDAQAAVDYVATHPILSKVPIIIYGQSLGGAVAIHAASKNADKISALIIENTFASIPDLVKGMPIIRHISWMCTQKWRSATKLSRLPPSLPILLLSGRVDQVIPYTHMDYLWKLAQMRGYPESEDSPTDEEYQPPPKDMCMLFPNGDHNNTFRQRGYWKSVFKFLNTIVPPAIQKVT